MTRPIRRLVTTLALVTASALMMSGCTPQPSEENLGSIRIRTFNLVGAINKGLGEASGAVEGMADDVGGAINSGFKEAKNEAGIVGRTAMSSVTEEYRNAAGEIVDAVGTVISYLPTSWPTELGSGSYKTIVKSLDGAIKQGIKAVNGIAKKVKNMSAEEAEEAINTVLGNVGTPNPKIEVPGISNPPVPVASHLYVKIRPSQWEESNAVNLQIDMDFLGLKKYRIGFGCLGFPEGFEHAPKVSFNGGCDNPWKLMQQANVMANAVKGIASKVGNEIKGLESQIIKTLKSVAGDADNPRLIPAMLLDIPVNQILGMLSPGYSSSESSKTPSKNTSDADAEENSAAMDAMQEMGSSAAIAFTVPELAGLTFQLSSDLSPVAYFDNWNSDGQMDIGVELGLFGVVVAGVKMGCVTFGTKWEETPSFSFDGGCDKSWNVDFAAGGYTSSSYRVDSRTASGASGDIPVATPTVSVAATPDKSTGASGGTVSVITVGSRTYKVHTFTYESDSDFYIPDSMSETPIEYLLIGGGGSGASNNTNKETGVGGGGAGGVVTNLGRPVKFAPGTYRVVVGAGGTSSYREGNGLNGGNSSINGAGLVALGGGGGGRLDANGNSGGSGGGAGYREGFDNPGLSLERQGNSGGFGWRGCSSDACSAGGGGGGAGSAGLPASQGNGGIGGDGIINNITGKSVWYAAGGGGGGIGIGVGRRGISGDGGYPRSSGKNGKNGTGSGGGGAASGSNTKTQGGLGGSGIVIIRYEINNSGTLSTTAPGSTFTPGKF